MGKGAGGGGFGPPPVIRPAVAPRTTPWPPPPAHVVKRPRTAALSWRRRNKPHADVALVGASAGQQGAAPTGHNLCVHSLAMGAFLTPSSQFSVSARKANASYRLLRFIAVGVVLRSQNLICLRQNAHGTSTPTHAFPSAPTEGGLWPTILSQHAPSSTGAAPRATHSTGEPGRPVWHAASSPCSLSSSSCVVRNSASNELIESQLASSASSSCSSHSPPKP
jgi:hypothetical protein